MTDGTGALLFVYGTLKPGRARWPALEPFTKRGSTPSADVVGGQLWDTPNGWPALTLTPAAGAVGLVVELAAATVRTALADLDAIEGVHAGLFIRASVVTRSGASCWTYLWPGPVDHFTPHVGPW